MPFKKGLSGNPSGRGKGVKNYSTLRITEILAENKEKLVNKAIELAEAGEISVLNKLLDKILPTLSFNKNENKNEDTTKYEKDLELIFKKANNLISENKN